MVDKIAGLARLIATLLAIVAAFVAIPATLDLTLVLVILGLIAGLKYRPEGTITLLLVVVALPLVGSALANIPAIGAQLNAVALNIQTAAAAVAATVIAMRLYNNSRDDVAGLAGTAGGTTAAASA